MAADFVRYYTITPVSKYLTVEDFVIYYNNKKHNFSLSQIL